MSGPLALADTLKFLRNNNATAERSQSERRGFAASGLPVRFQSVHVRMCLPAVAVGLVGSFELFVCVNGAMRRLPLFLMHLNAIGCDLAFAPEVTGVKSSCLQTPCECRREN